MRMRAYVQYLSANGEWANTDCDPAAFAAWRNAEIIALKNVADERAILSVA